MICPLSQPSKIYLLSAFFIRRVLSFPFRSPRASAVGPSEHSIQIWFGDLISERHLHELEMTCNTLQKQNISRDKSNSACHDKSQLAFALFLGGIFDKPHVFFLASL